MNSRFKPLFFLIGAGLTMACGPGSGDGDDSPFSYSANASHAGTADAGTADADAAVEGIDFRAIPTEIAESQHAGALAVSALGSLLSSFVPVAHPLDVTASANANAAIVAANLRAVGCAGATDSHSSDTAYLLVDLGPSCILANSKLTTSGNLQIGITGDTTPGAAWAAAQLQLVGVVVNGIAIDGFANIATNGKTQTLTTRVTIGKVGIVTFSGTSVDGTGGSAPGLSLNGTGTFTGPTHTTPTSADGWICASSPVSFLGFRQMTKLTTQCYPNGGALDVRTAYACTKGDPSAPTDRQTVVATTTVSYDVGTGSSGNATFSVSLPASASGDGTPIASSSTLVCPAQ